MVLLLGAIIVFIIAEFLIRLAIKRNTERTKK